jgi:hypothetical protein
VQSGLAEHLWRASKPCIVQSESRSTNRASIRHALNYLAVLDKVPGPLIIRGALGAVEVDEGLGALLLELGLESEISAGCTVVPIETLERWHQSQSHRRSMWTRAKKWLGF